MPGWNLELPVTNVIIPVFNRGVVMPWKPYKSGLLTLSFAWGEDGGAHSLHEVLTVLYLGGALPTLGKQMLLGGSTWSHLTLGFWTRCKEAKIEWGGESIAGTPNVAVSFLEFYVCLLAVVVDAWPLLRLSAKSGWDVCKGNHGVAVFWVV